MCRDGFSKPCDECHLTSVYCRDYPTTCDLCYERTQAILYDVDAQCERAWATRSDANCDGPVDSFPAGEWHRDVLCRQHQRLRGKGVYSRSSTGWF